MVESLTWPGPGMVCLLRWELQRPSPNSGSKWRPSSIDSVYVKLVILEYHRFIL